MAVWIELVQKNLWMCPWNSWLCGSSSAAEKTPKSQLLRVFLQLKVSGVGFPRSR